MTIALPARRILTPRFEFPAFLRNLKDDAVSQMRSPLGGAGQIGGALGVGRGAAIVAWLPADKAGLQVWLKADAGLTLSTSGFAGNGTVTQSGTAVTGSGSFFTAQVIVGDTITATGISGVVTLITDNTHLTLSTSATQAVGQTFTVTPGTGNDRVTTWADQSGNSRNFAQATGFLKPSKLAAAQNSLPAVWFHGGNYLASATWSAGNETTWFFVVKPINAAAGIFDSAPSNANTFRNISAGNWEIHPGNPTFALGLTLNNPYVLGFTTTVISARRVIYRRNAAAVSTNTGSGTTSITYATPVIGAINSGAPYFDGYLLEMFAYNSILSADEIASAEAYVNGRWALY